ncbi:hypothetical protein SERLA73DRAFT_75349 [Serpula lacrymans var. lacrymans S7.3]|uniref:Carrier domain-containing protein n=2 Tax=Serpula lacrymans var. lacrymans TaxID=341189 RepID=F8Q3C8_SERL3|nr:putative nonribosomal peptide synthetase [Serpula lacrymans var. lacrymans S7.9]EGN97689.1 hypothetical protein SERLA73DRAFT_75349 [Serpula lacrymans var. lacrymans S7.3]EGO23283.1 putative nonribosomal peptide synthetase [Serpula lacrymans var. lacrymans S7.9]
MPFNDLIRRFQIQVSLRPDAIAVQDASFTLTYQELDRWSNNLAREIHLRARHLNLEVSSPIAICIPRSALLIVSVLAVVKAGFSYTPLDSAAPLARLDDQVSQCGTSILLVAAGLAGDHISSLGRADTFDIAAFINRTCVQEHQELVPPDSELCDNTLLAVFWTSGSTGRPKGVCIEHESMLNLIDRRLMDIQPGDHVAMTATPSFDVSSLEMWNSLINGATVFILTSSLGDTETTVKFFCEHKIQKVFLPTTVFHRLANDDEISSSLGKTLSWILVGGERLNMASVNNFFHHAPHTRILNGYGSAETTIHATDFEVPRDLSKYDDAAGKPIPVGRPITGVRVFLLDENLHAVGFGIPGEICISGAGLARGYLGESLSSSKRFVTIADIEEPGSSLRIYRTGDLGKFVSSDQGPLLEYVGRIDNQVKIRGQRVELAEVENVLCAGMDGAEESAVIVAEDKMIAYVTKNADSEHDDKKGGTTKDAWDAFQAQYDWENIDPTLTGADFTGWVSMYDGVQIPRPAMEDWLADTLKSIQMKDGDSVLEIGCGTGMILFSLESRYKEYVGIDMSESSVAFVKAQVNRRGLGDKVEVFRGMADELEQLLPAKQRFSLVIINSVTQYFPSGEYLEQILQSCIARVQDGGRIFIGDLRSWGLDKHHDLARILHCDPSPELSTSDIQDRLDRWQLRQTELKVNPSFFYHLANKVGSRVSHVEILPKMMTTRNELSQFRQQVCLHIGSHAPVLLNPASWVEYTTASELDNILSSGASEIIAIHSIPNALVAGQEAALQLLRSDAPPSTATDLIKNATVSEWCSRALSPQDISALAARLGYQVDISWKASGVDRTLAAVFSRTQSELKTNFGDIGLDDQPTNILVESKAPPAKGNEFISKLRARCREKLPSYMIPNHFIMMDALPLTNNGKVDRKLLAEPSSWKDLVSAEAQEVEMYQPENETEGRVQRCVGEVLDMDTAKVPLHTDLIELGLHSFRTPKLLSALRVEFAFDALSYATVYKCATVAALGAYLEREAPKKQNSGNPTLPRESKRREVPYDEEALNKVLLARGFTVADVEDVFETNISQRLPFEEPIPGFCMSHESWTVHTDFDTLIKALETVITRQGALRSTSFSCYSRQVVFRYSQTIRDEVIKVHSPEDVPDVRALLEDPASYAFTPPETWWRFNVIKTNPITLFCCFHQSTLDGWGRQILFGEIESIILGHTLPDPVPFRNFIDYAVNEWARKSSAEWLANRLSSSDAIPFPPCDENLAYSAASVLGPNFERTERLSGITNISHAYGIHSSTLLKAAIALVMRNQTKRSSVAFGQVQFGRNAPVEGITQICGMLINCLVDCVDFRPGDTVLELLRRIQMAQDELMDRSLVNFDEVLRYCNRDFNPFFNFIWNLRTRREPKRTVIQPGALGFDTPVAIIWTTIVDGEDVKVEVDYDASFSQLLPSYTSQFFEAARWLISNIEAQDIDELN